MKKTLTSIAMISILLASGYALADETRAARPVVTTAARHAARRSAPRVRNADGPARETTAASSPLIRAFGSCDAASFEELAAEIGRLAAMEECTSRGRPSAASRELSRTAPRQSDLGIPEEAFDAGFEVSGL